MAKPDLGGWSSDHGQTASPSLRDAHEQLDCSPGSTRTARSRGSSVAAYAAAPIGGAPTRGRSRRGSRADACGPRAGQAGRRGSSAAAISASSPSPAARSTTLRQLGQVEGLVEPSPAARQVPGRRPRSRSPSRGAALVAHEQVEVVDRRIDVRPRHDGVGLEVLDARKRSAGSLRTSRVIQSADHGSSSSHCSAPRYSHAAGVTYWCTSRARAAREPRTSSALTTSSSSSRRIQSPEHWRAATRVALGEPDSIRKKRSASAA